MHQVPQEELAQRSADSRVPTPCHALQSAHFGNPEELVGAMLNLRRETVEEWASVWRSHFNAALQKAHILIKYGQKFVQKHILQDLTQ